MYKMAFLENMVNDRFFKKSSFIDRIADTVNFAANAKVLDDMTNTSLSTKIENGRKSSDDEDAKKRRGLAILFTGDLGDAIPEEQRRKIVEIARRISDERKTGSKVRK